MNISSPLPECAAALFELVQQAQAQRVLEVGCGTGFWLDLLASKVRDAYGLDNELHIKMFTGFKPGAGL
jgi:protein-L-isoaspartate O-methyltransferase